MCWVSINRDQTKSRKEINKIVQLIILFVKVTEQFKRIYHALNTIHSKKSSIFGLSFKCCRWIFFLSALIPSSTPPPPTPYLPQPPTSPPTHTHYSKKFRNVLRKRYSENIQQIYRRTLKPKCDFNKVAWATATLLKPHFGMGVLL